MAKSVLKDTAFYLGGYEITTDLFSTTQLYESEEQDGTSFGGTGYRETLAGLKTHSFSDAGRNQMSGADIDPILFGLVGVSNTVRSFIPNGPTEGNTGGTTRIMAGLYNPYDGGEVGTVHNFGFTGQNQGVPLIRGTAIHIGAETSTGNGTEYAVGAVSAGQTVYGACHLHSVTGAGTLDVTVEHDLTGFASPTLSLTFGQFTAIGADWQTNAADVTADTFWRVTYTISGFTSVSFMTMIGIM